MNYWIIFITGLTAGGLSCLAVQGGLLTAIIANQKEEEFDKNKPTGRNLDWLPVTMFLAAKLVIHVLFGFLLGALGSVLSLSLGLRLTFQIFTALFMIATAMNLLNVHPIFRYLAFQPPRFLQRLVHNSSKSRALYAPALLGLLSVFIPCGVTQAMEVLAISSGHPLTGGLIMFFFVLGTAPLFAIIGVATAKLSDALRGRFFKFVSVVLILMALYSVNGVLQVLDAPITLQKASAAVTGLFQKNKTAQAPLINTEKFQAVTIQVSNSGYSPRQFTVRAGQPVVMTVATDNVYSCASSFTFREFKIFTQLEPTDSKTFRFTPTKKGTFTFACSMGMYTGTMKVI
jgi:sulfite exporter TauE/SafE